MRDDQFILTPVESYVTMHVWIRHDFSWLGATLECGRVTASESYGLLMIGNNHELDLTNLLETLRYGPEKTCGKHSFFLARV